MKLDITDHDGIEVANGDPYMCMVVNEELGRQLISCGTGFESVEAVARYAVSEANFGEADRVEVFSLKATVEIERGD